ncbi:MULTISPECIES: AI-2E family transporter [Rathayibacter]|jgi:predicted PurR-regulated permease PerM|uniref:AI-2E family transporter n=1 Tax=Rathayibacter festucae DSM 15932 TaxID=1328866 RepID=A0A3Q9V2F9_9MICO|nr:MULTISPECIES: AI-2E family transporter [Rathayibacter]AZZ53966.1 AI-2E family transporter [Rathayibacter festucae DSM 15932]MCJ1686431.1 AI-2E family transporter [Rathayibacter sp. VKM Ac-2927]MCJ1702381.1 AI-2E family transporter [Rathayibacter sp. VKM Ac-2926]ROP56958.1 putative PurR-regulated permease PerM [Rathayibacter sp. PhB186]ROS55343.1 putative PurR-regulated permease PerM [Rathayibacter sp. PhB185]
MGFFDRTVPPAASPAASPATPPAERRPTVWTDGLGRFALRCLQVLVVLALAAVLVLAMTQLTLVLIPVLIAIILASAIHPVLAWMRRKGVPSILATWIALIGLLAILGAIGWLITVAVRNQWDELVSSASDGIASLQDYVQHLPFQIDEQQIEDARQSVVDFLTSSSFGSGALAGAAAAANFVTGLVLMIVVLFFFMKDGPKIWEFLLRPFTGSSYDRAKRVGGKTVDVLGGYIRGTATVAAVDAIGIGVALAILQVPLALPLAVIVFLTAFIPIVGATAAGILAALVALVANGPLAALIVIIVVIAVNQLEGNFLQPVVMARSLKLHPLIVLIALTIGTVLAGIVGAVLAVPIAAVAWGIVSVWNGPDRPAEPARQKRDESV